MAERVELARSAGPFVIGPGRTPTGVPHGPASSGQGAGDGVGSSSAAPTRSIGFNSVAAVPKSDDDGGPDAGVAGLPPDDEAGDPACWAGLLCPECGVVLGGAPHEEGCSVPRLVP